MSAAALLRELLDSGASFYPSAIEGGTSVLSLAEWAERARAALAASDAVDPDAAFRAAYPALIESWPQLALGSFRDYAPFVRGWRAARATSGASVSEAIAIVRYIGALSSHDWDFERSDDQGNWRRGSAEREALRTMQAEVDPGLEIWNTCAPAAHRRTS